MPIEDRQAARESMCPAARIDHELQGNVVRRAAVCEHRLRADGATVARDHRLLKCRLLAKGFSRSWGAALPHDDRSLPGRHDAKISVSVDVDRLIGPAGRCWCWPGTRCLRSRLNRNERDCEQGGCSLHGGDDPACHSGSRRLSVFICVYLWPALLIRVHQCSFCGPLFLSVFISVYLWPALFICVYQCLSVACSSYPCSSVFICGPLFFIRVRRCSSVAFICGYRRALSTTAALHGPSLVNRASGPKSSGRRSQ